MNILGTLAGGIIMMAFAAWAVHRINNPKGPAPEPDWIHNPITPTLGSVSEEWLKGHRR